MNAEYSVASFYKYAVMENPQEFQREQLKLCNSLDLKGRIMIGEEGINGSVYGSKENVQKYKEALKRTSALPDIEFKEQDAAFPAFRKLFVRLRKEIVHFGAEVDLRDAAEYIEPKKLKEWLDSDEDVALVDMRNDYEAKIGKFNGARTFSMRNFRDLPKVLSEIEDLKDKKIVTYCTGGIRCEKASAFLKENGFRNVYQLHGGILRFGEEFPDTYWIGKCFVFDDRISITLNKKNHDAIAECGWCKKKCDDYVNCHNIECDKLFLCCEGCGTAHDSSCSERCSKAPNRRRNGLK